MSLINKLLEKGLIDKEKAASLQSEAKGSGKNIEELILGQKIVPENIVFAAKSEDLKIPLRDVTANGIALKTLESIPEETAKYYQMIPLKKEENSLEVGMVYPENLKAQEALKFLTRQKNLNYKVFLITPTVFNDLLGQYKSLKEEMGRALEELQVELEEETEKVKAKTVEEYEKIAEEAPVTKIVAVILRYAVDGNASDIHIEPTKEKLRVRFRLLGDLHSSIILPIKIHPAVVARIKILSNLKIDESRMPQDGRFSTKIDGKAIDYRVSTFPTALGEKVAIRILDPEFGKKSFKELGLQGRNLTLVEEAIEKPFGLILVTGPTGSGKTTTLYSILHLLNSEEVNIITLEDPLEYFIEGVNQSQVRPDIGYTFASGLRHILRQDPDVIMVGEIRDEETASLVIHAALTGHIVLSTLHTSDSLGVIPRLIDMGVKPYLIPPTLQVAIAQRLVRRLCDSCKVKADPNPKIKEFILKELEGISEESRIGLEIPKTFEVYEPKGCPKCGNTGFSGRLAIYEALSMTSSLADLVLKDISETKLSKEARDQGMVTIRQDGIVKVLKGLTTIEEILRATEERI
jgi:type IV pilus assembly protein PilB